MLTISITRPFGKPPVAVFVLELTEPDKNKRLTQDFPRILPTSMQSSTSTTSSFTAIALHVSCLICSGIAENDEVVAVEDFIDVGNNLGKI